MLCLCSPIIDKAKGGLSPLVIIDNSKVKVINLCPGTQALYLTQKIDIFWKDDVERKNI